MVTPIRLFVWLIFLGTAYEFLLKHIWENWRMSRIQDRLRGHVIVAGFGTSGAEAVRELIRRGVAPSKIVVIDPRPAALEEGRDEEVAAMTRRAAELRTRTASVTTTSLFGGPHPRGLDGAGGLRRDLAWLTMVAPAATPQRRRVQQRREFVTPCLWPQPNRRPRLWQSQPLATRTS